LIGPGTLLVKGTKSQTPGVHWPDSLIGTGRLLVKGAEQRQTPAVDWLDSLISQGGLGFSNFPPICRVAVLVLGLGLEKIQ
jgi:hypothetical protein